MSIPLEPPKYSVIIPVYNSANTIEKVLQALLAQNRAGEMEIIVVDDGSVDDTASVVEKYPVRIFKKVNRGPASARNLGINSALGEIILFIDADCVPQSGWFQSMTQPFFDSDITGVKGIYVNNSKSLIARFVQLEFEERYLLLNKHKYIDFVDTYCAAFRKKALLEVGGFDENFPRADNEDVDLSYKLARSGYKMVFCPQAKVEHLNHPSTLLRYVKLKFNRGFWRLAVYKRHPQKALKDSYTPQSLKLQIILIPLIWASIASGLFFNFYLPLIIFFFAFLLLNFTFEKKVFHFDQKAALLTPFLHFLRANSFFAGLIAGLFGHFNFKRKN